MSETIDPKDVDKRTFKRHLQSGRLDEKAYEKHLKSLPDISEKGTAVEAVMFENDDIDGDDDKE